MATAVRDLYTATRRDIHPAVSTAAPRLHNQDVMGSVRMSHRTTVIVGATLLTAEPDRLPLLKHTAITVL